MLYPSNTYTFRLFDMKVLLDVYSLCESAADLVGPTLEIFKKQRTKKNFGPVKIQSVVEAIMTKPKNFLHLSMDNLLGLTGFSREELRRLVKIAVTSLMKSKSKNIVQVTVFETGDERVLRGD